MYCKKCGAELKEGQKFCTKCGTPVSSESNTEAKFAGPGNADSGATKDVTPKKTNTKVIAGIIAAVAVVAVIIIVVATRSGGSEEQIAETELEPEQIEETAQSEYEDEYAEDEYAEDEESGLTAGEQEQLRQQEIIDNIDLDLTVKRGKYYNYLSDAIDAANPDPDVLYNDPDYYDPLDLYYVSGTITNNNDEDYCFYLQYNIEETYTDNYGDQQTEEIEPKRSDDEVWVAAHDTVPYYDKWSKYFSVYEQDKVVSYVCTGVEVYLGDTGTVSTTPWEYNDGKLLPISEVSDLRFAAEVDEYGYIMPYMAFTITNNTDDRWSKVVVDFYILLNGEYMERYTCEGEYIKPGETVQVEDDYSIGYYHTLPDQIFNSDGSTVDEIELQICGVEYTPDTSE